MHTHPYHDPKLQQTILAGGTRDEIIQWLVWNDRNGTYSDDDSSMEGMLPLTLDAARMVMADILARG